MLLQYFEIRDVEIMLLTPYFVARRKMGFRRIRKQEGIYSQNVI